jgi:xylan 1,4-beta-xylosidase
MLVAGTAAWPGFAQDTDAKVSIHIDASSRRGAMTPMWAFFGHDEPNYTYMADGRKLLSELASLSLFP